MKRLGVVLVMLALTVPVLAGNIDVVSSGPIHMGAANGAHGRATTVYSNFTNFTYAYTATSGVTAADVGDDLDMVSGGILDEVSFTVWNGMSATAPLPNLLTGCALQLTFYSGVLDANNVMNYSYAGGFNTTGDFSADPLSPGYFTGLTVTGLSGLNINLTANIIASLKITALTGGSTKAGQILADPPTLGSSDDMFFKNGQLGWWFGGPPVIANFGWEIGVIPEPASMILLGLAGLLIRRR